MRKFLLSVKGVQSKMPLLKSKTNPHLKCCNSVKKHDSQARYKEGVQTTIGSYCQKYRIPKKCLWHDSVTKYRLVISVTNTKCQNKKVFNDIADQ